MVKVVSYRQKLIELAKIYKIDRVFDQKFKHTTYDIEIILLRSKVPLPSRRGYISHVLINKVYKPLYDIVRRKLSTIFSVSKYFDINLNKYFKTQIEEVKKKISITINLKRHSKRFFGTIENYFQDIIFNICNFFKVLSKTIIDGLNNFYNFKVKEKIIKNLFSKVIYTSIVFALISSGFYIKNILTEVDSIKIALEIKSKKNENVKKLKNKEVLKTPGNIRQDSSKKLVKLPKDKKILLSNNDYKLNTQTVLNLFEDLEYDLDKVRNKKKVKPIYFTRLPKDLNNIKSVKEKKETFLKILLPLIVAENEKIKKDREYLLKILKENDSDESKKWLNKKYKAYKVSDRKISELIEKIDIIPTSIALAQAAKESGWGTSRFALEGNAVYGQWTWNGEGIEPLEKTKDQKHKILKFPLLRASVKAYITNLNTHRGYKSFRVKRAMLREKNKKLVGLELIHELDNYAQTGEKYTKTLEKIIKQNDLDELEAVSIDDFRDSNQLKL
jgi:Bax protein